MQPWREMRSPLGERRGLQRDGLSLSSEGPAGAHRWRGGLAFEAEEGVCKSLAVKTSITYSGSSRKLVTTVKNLL